MSNWNPGLSLSSLEFVSSREMQALEAAGMITVGDLLDWFPRRHEDRRRFDTFPVQVSGEPVCLRGRVVDSARKRFGGRRQFYEIVIEEGGDSVFSSSRISCRWFNMPYLHRMVAWGMKWWSTVNPRSTEGASSLITRNSRSYRRMGEAPFTSSGLFRFTGIFPGSRPGACVN